MQNEYTVLPPSDLKMENTYLSIVEFACRMSLHPNTVRRLIKTSRIQAINMGSATKKIYRIPESEIQRLGIFDLREMIRKIDPDDLKE